MCTILTIVATFDPVVFRARSTARLRRALDTGSADAIKRHAIELDCIEHLQVVIFWCQDHGLIVDFDHRAGGLYYDKKRIRVNQQARADLQLYWLLHECGHFLIDARGTGHGRFHQGYAATDTLIKRTDAHRIDIIAEELEAWHAAKKLAIRLGIDLDIEAFNKWRVSCVKTYVKWCAQPGQYQLRVDSGDNDDDSQ